MSREDAIKYGNLLEQRLINQYQLNKIEAFYVFNCQEGNINDRLNQVLDSRNESSHYGTSDDEFEFELPENCDVVSAPRTMYDCTLKEEFEHIGSYGVFYI